MKSISKTLALGILVALIAGATINAYAADTQWDNTVSKQIGK
jgi:hypothetical protein